MTEIYRYTRDRCGAEQADRYIADLFAAFGKIEVHGVASRPIPAEFGGVGFHFRHAHHFVHWRRLSNGDIGIVTILHQRLHQMDRVRVISPTDPGFGTQKAPAWGARRTLTRC